MNFEDDVKGSCEEIHGLKIVDAMMAFMVAQNPTAEANGTAYEPLTRGRFATGQMDTSEVLENNGDQLPYLTWIGVPGSDLDMANFEIEFGGVFLNAAMLLKRYMDPVERQKLINARIAQGKVEQ